MAPRKTSTGEPTESKVKLASVADTDDDEANTDTSETTQVVRRQDLLGRVADSSGLKRPQIKPVMEAVLRELGEALAKGESLNLPPLGKVVVTRTRETENANIIVAKLRRSKNAGKPKDTANDDEALAEPAE